MRLSSLIRPPVMGIALCRDSVEAAVLEARGGSWRLQNHASVPYRAPLVQGSTDHPVRADFTPEHLEHLTESLIDLERRFDRPPKVVQLSLPDPIAMLRLFQLERMPRGRRLLKSLAEWRFQREFGLAPEQIAVAAQPMGRRNGEHLLLGIAVPRPWLVLAQQACRRAGLVLTVVDVEGAYRHNRFYRALVSEKRGGVLVSLQPWSWSISAWDAAGRLSFLRGHWRGLEPDEPAALPGLEHTGAERRAVWDVSEIGQQVERTVRAFARYGSENQVFNVFILGPGQPVADLSAHLNARMRERCRVLQPDADLDAGAETPSPVGPDTGQAFPRLSPAIAAAMPR